MVESKIAEIKYLSEVKFQQELSSDSIARLEELKLGDAKQSQ